MTPGRPRPSSPRTVGAAAAVLLVATVACGGAGRGTSSSVDRSLAARARLIALVDETLRATAGGLRVEPEESATKADPCTPPGERHNWTYTRYVDVVGERAARLSRDAEAYWTGRGYDVTHGPAISVFTQTEDVHVTLRDVGTNGSDGVVVGGSTTCFDGPPPAVP